MYALKVSRTSDLGGGPNKQINRKKQEEGEEAIVTYFLVKLEETMRQFSPILFLFIFLAKSGRLIYAVHICID